jgi:hypothetical protein
MLATTASHRGGCRRPRKCHTPDAQSTHGTRSHHWCHRHMLGWRLRSPRCPVRGAAPPPGPGLGSRLPAMWGSHIGSRIFAGDDPFSELGYGRSPLASVPTCSIAREELVKSWPPGCGGLRWRPVREIGLRPRSDPSGRQGCVTTARCPCLRKGHGPRAAPNRPVGRG